MIGNIPLPRKPLATARRPRLPQKALKQQKAPGGAFRSRSREADARAGPRGTHSRRPARKKKGPLGGPSAREAPCGERDVLPSAARGRSTLGDGGLSFRVRNGDRAIPASMVAPRAGRSAPRAASPQGARTARTLAAAQRASNRGPPHAGHAMRRARAISGARLSASPPLAPAPYRPPRLGGPLPKRGTHLGGGFPLRCLQRLSAPDVARQPCRWSTTAAPEVRPPRSSRTRGSSPQFSCACGG